MRLFPDSFTLAPDPTAIADRLLTTCPDFAHFQDVRLAWFFSERAVRDRGTDAYALIAFPATQGRFRTFFEFLVNEKAGTLDAPLDFIVLVDHALWDAAEPVCQERICYHELCHVRLVEDEHGTPKLDDAGRPRFALRPHDVEVFTAETARYGVDVCRLDDLCLAIADHERARRRRA